MMNNTPDCNQRNKLRVLGNCLNGTTFLCHLQT